MTKKSKFIIVVVMCSLCICASIVSIILACVSANKKYDGVKFSHNIYIKEIETDNATLSGVVYHYVSLEGDIKNLTEENLKSAEVVIVFKGIENNTGMETEYETSLSVKDLYAGASVSVDEKVIKIGNKAGFVPTEIKSIEVTLADGQRRIEATFVKGDSSVVLAFGLGLAISLVAGVIMITNISKFKKEK